VPILQQLWLITLLSFASDGACTPPIISALAVTLHAQETGDWCWAASGQMVMDYLGHNVTQSAQANNRFGRTDCPSSQCSSAAVASPPCISGGWPEFKKYGFTFKKTLDTALTWDQLRNEVANAQNCGKRPFVFSWHWPQDGGHMMVVNGYVTVGGKKYVSVLDPGPVCRGEARIIPYEFYDSSPGDHTHWDDYYEIK
jgi:hypothetical protein